MMMMVMVIVIVMIWRWWQWQLYCWQWSPWPWHLSPHMVQSLTPTSVGSLQTGIPHLASQVQTAASTLESSANLRSTRSYIQCHYQEKWTANNFRKVVDKRRSDRQAAQCAHVTVMIYIYTYEICIFIYYIYTYHYQTSYNNYQSERGHFISRIKSQFKGYLVLDQNQPTNQDWARPGMSGRNSPPQIPSAGNLQWKAKWRSGPKSKKLPWFREDLGNRQSVQACTGGLMSHLIAAKSEIANMWSLRFTSPSSRFLKYRQWSCL